MGVYKSKLIKSKENKTLFDYIEKIAYRLQYAYMKTRISREKVAANFAYFHPTNLSEKVLAIFQNRLSEV
jgi:hypothetical protein